jgi:hypothetical protein
MKMQKDWPYDGGELEESARPGKKDSNLATVEGACDCWQNA